MRKLFLRWSAWLREDRGGDLPAKTIILCLGVVIGLGVVGVVGRALYNYFHTFGNCLNGC